MTLQLNLDIHGELIIDSFAGGVKYLKPAEREFIMPDLFSVLEAA